MNYVGDKTKIWRIGSSISRSFSCIRLRKAIIEFIEECKHQTSILWSNGKQTHDS